MIGPVDASTTVGAIVAGGLARRLGGQDKCRLVVEGRTIIVRQLTVLQQVTERVIIAGGTADRFADLGVTVFADERPGLGAIGGIYTAVLRARADSVLVVACDLPFLDARLLRHLVEAAQPHDGAWVSTARGVEPLVACYRAHAIPAIARQIERGRLKAADLGDILDMAAVDEAVLGAWGGVDRLLTNVNSPEDYARVQYGRS